MIECGCRAGFLLETSYSFLVLCKLARKKLERDLSTEPGVASQIDFAHPAGSQRLENGVWTNVFSRLDTQRRHPSCDRRNHGGPPFVQKHPQSLSLALQGFQLIPQLSCGYSHTGQNTAIQPPFVDTRFNRQL